MRRLPHSPRLRCSETLLRRPVPGRAGLDRGRQPHPGLLEELPDGPFEGSYIGIVGAAWADWLFIIGLGAIGAALILGIGVRIAAASSAVLLVMVWTAALPPENKPFMDDHLIYALVLVGLALVSAGDTLGFGRWWATQSWCGATRS